jgi:AIPR protein.
MDAQEFRRDFLEDIKADALATGEGSCASFVSSFARYLQEAEYLLDFTSSYFEGIGRQNRKLRVDGYAYDELDKAMSLIIADYDASDNDRTLNKTQASQLQNRLIYFIDDALNTQLYRNIEMSRSCSDLVDLLRMKRKEIRKYQLLIFTTAGISTTIKILETDSIDGIPSECQIWNIERLFQLCGSDSGRHIIEINFKEYTDKGIPCLEASSVALDDFKSYLCIIPGTALADIYDKFGSSLLEGNVRSFLSTKVAVNKKIRTTILQQPERFFAYNNGISATAMDVQFEHTEQGLFLVSARDFQIINGGQTTASLSSARYNYKDKANLGVIFVQMKLTVINGTLEDDVATTLVQNISRSSNSQNKVSDADFFSTHPFHVQMERCSQRLGARGTGGLQFETKWFYERARGQYLQKQMRMTASEKKKFLLQHPKNQLITKTDLAKVRNTWDGLPHIVSKGAQANFMDFAQKISDAWDKDDGLLFGDKYFQESVALCLIFRYTEIMIPHQPWYQQGYRANIVTYTIAILHKLIRTQFPKKDLDLTRIWVRQTIPAAVQNVLVELSKCVYERLTDPMRSIDNVTQWCKREGCWNSVQSIDFKLPSEIEDCLVGQDAMRTVIKEAKAERRIEMDADVMTRVVEIRPNQWHNVMDFAVSRRMITSEEKTALCIACQLPTKVPTPAQSRRLIQLLDRLYEEGFKL